MSDQTLLYIVAMTTAGLVGKIIFDWLKNRNGGGYVTHAEFEMFKKMILDKFEKIERRLERIENILMGMRQK